MGTLREERLAQLRGELGRQNERWGSAMGALAQLGDVRVSVPREFFERLDALAPRGVAAPQGLRA
jgi:hypothetical protein